MGPPRAHAGGPFAPYCLSVTKSAPLTPGRTQRVERHDEPMVTELATSEPAAPDTPAPERPARWSGRVLWGGFALAVLCYLGASLVGAFVGTRLGWVEGPLLGLALALAQGALALPPLILLLRRGHLVSALGLNRFHPVMLLDVVLALGFGFMAMCGWGIVLVALDQRAQEPIVPLFGEGVGALLSVFAVGAVLAPMVEELVFRGFLFGGLRPWIHPLLAAVISGAIFGALHFH